MTNKMTKFLKILRQEFWSFKQRVKYRMDATVKAYECTYTDDMTFENYGSAIEHCEDIFDLMCGLGFLTNGRYEQDTNKICETKLLLEAEYDRKLELKSNKELDECLI